MSVDVTAREQVGPQEPARRKYVPGVGPKLRKLLMVVFVLVALLAANSVYLASITFLEWATSNVYQDYFYLVMFLVHLVLGIAFTLPILIFGALHMKNTFRRKNRRAVMAGYALFSITLALLVSGFLLVRIEGVFDLKHPLARSVTYWVHVGCPLAAAWLYWLHRLAGPPIRWRIARGYAAVVAVAVAAMVALHATDPREWNVVGPESGVQYFEPSLARTATGNFIPSESMMMDQYCIRCHEDAHQGWVASAHHLSSFNNPAYLATIREVREVLLERDGSVQASRWCAGCHDPVPFFSGAFDDPQFDDVHHPTAQAGITCTSCHAITHVNSTRGNADFTIDEPQHYPFAYSENPALQWVNNQLVKAKPSFHKKTFLKPLHKTAEFCSSCHKVHLPYAVNHYKEFLRGQNHYDSFLLSGVSGGGARSFYYPPQAEQNCNNCHMPLQASDDFGAQFFGSDQLSIHDHLFVGANTAVAWWADRDDAVAAHAEFSAESMRVDLFGIREGVNIDGPLHAPLRPDVPEVTPGRQYLLEAVIRTLKLGHHFTQGTVDSNEIWLEVTVRSGDRILGGSGHLEDSGQVDPWSHFVNVFMLDKDGNRIDRRNAQDIFVPLYNNQIPPGAGQTVHYELRIPEDVTEPVTVELALKYRKFDARYMEFIRRSRKDEDLPIRGFAPDEPDINPLPIMILAADRVTFPLAGSKTRPENPLRDIPAWQRWNDYGIGLLLKGKAQLRQAAEAFREVEALGRYDGPLNLARVLYREGDSVQAVDALKRAAAHTDPPAPPWTLAWLTGLVNRDMGRLKEAEANFRSILEPTAQTRQRGFDFRNDYEVLNLLGQTLFDLGRQQRTESQRSERDAYFREAVEMFERTLELDVENVDAHYNLALLFTALDDEDAAARHRELHARYKPDDNARGKAVAAARKKYPAADRAAEAVVIYDLHRANAPQPHEVPTNDDHKVTQHTP